MFKNISDATKFMAFFGIYIFYMTWWAATLTNNMKNVQKSQISTQAILRVMAENFTKSTIENTRLNGTIIHLVELQSKQDQSIQVLQAKASNCGEKHRAIKLRLDRLHKGGVN